MNDHNSRMFCYMHVILISAGGFVLTPPNGQLYLTYGVSLTSHLKFSVSQSLEKKRTQDMKVTTHTCMTKPVQSGSSFTQRALNDRKTASHILVVTWYCS